MPPHQKLCYPCVLSCTFHRRRVYITLTQPDRLTVQQWSGSWTNTLAKALHHGYSCPTGVSALHTEGTQSLPHTSAEISTGLTERGGGSHKSKHKSLDSAQVKCSGKLRILGCIRFYSTEFFGSRAWVLNYIPGKMSVVGQLPAAYQHELRFNHSS